MAKSPPRARPVARKTVARKPKESIFSKKITFGGGGMSAMKEADVLLFTGELADLLEAGMTLGEALGCLANQGEEDSAQRAVCKDLTSRIVNGESFSDAVAHHPKTFQPLYANMIRAGEASGAMVDVLRRLVEHYERSDSMRAKIKGALRYPCFVLAFGVIAVVITMKVIIPKFQKVFQQLGGQLPGPTRALMDMTDFVNSWKGAALGVAIALASVWLFKWAKTPAGRRKIDAWKLKMPLVKGIVACGAYSTLAYTLKTLLTNGVNVLNALKIAEDTCENAVIADALHTARKRVTDGTSISGPLATSGVFPRLMTDMLAVGERAGDLSSSLGHIGTRYQKEMDSNIKTFTEMLPMVLLFVLAGVIGFIIYAIFSAVFAVSNSLGA
ncbi:MAG: type II secretion system F family protein [Kiritimatiellae bacterium]|nr:type II secretion system F family protein [Kiritimatiellia bacterium]